MNKKRTIFFLASIILVSFVAVVYFSIQYSGTEPVAQETDRIETHLSVPEDSVQNEESTSWEETKVSSDSVDNSIREEKIFSFLGRIEKKDSDLWIIRVQTRYNAPAENRIQMRIGSCPTSFPEGSDLGFVVSHTAMNEYLCKGISVPIVSF